MKLNYQCSGKTRKRLAGVIARITGQEASYQGAPSFAYRIGCMTVGVGGEIEFDDTEEKDKAEMLVKALAEEGFEIHGNESQEVSPPGDETLLTIEMPRAGFTKAELENLKAIVKAKSHLLSKALGKKPLPLIITEDKVSFPWFSSDATSEENKAYMFLVSRLCILARKVKRVSMQESRDVGNDKYGCQRRGIQHDDAQCTPFP